MPCIVDITKDEMTQHFEILLCRACKFLTVEQIETLTNPGSGIQDGIDWYSHHLWLDCTHNVKNDVLHFIDEADLEIERRIAVKELNRIGYDVKPYDDKGSTELIKLIDKV